MVRSAAIAYGESAKARSNAAKSGIPSTERVSAIASLKLKSEHLGFFDLLFQALDFCFGATNKPADCDIPSVIATPQHLDGLTLELARR